MTQPQGHAAQPSPAPVSPALPGGSLEDMIRRLEGLEIGLDRLGWDRSTRLWLAELSTQTTRGFQVWVGCAQGESAQEALSRALFQALEGNFREAWVLVEGKSWGRRRVPPDWQGPDPGAPAARVFRGSPGPSLEDLGLG